MKKMISLAAVAVLAMTMAACTTLAPPTGTAKSISGSQTGSKIAEDNCYTPKGPCL